MYKDIKSPNKYVSEICNLFKRKELKFIFSDIKECHGYYVTVENTNLHIIILDTKKEFIPTLIHECIHFLYPKYSEKKTLYAENVIMESGTNNIMKILKGFSSDACVINKELEDLI